MTHPVVTAHERRIAELDPLLPGTQPLPEPRPGDALLATDGAVGIARLDRPDPDSLDATWGAAEQHRLLARVGGPEPVAAMGQLLARWQRQVAGQAGVTGPDTEAILTWPSRDAPMTTLFLAHGLAPLTVVAARPPGRPSPETASDVVVRPAVPADLEPAAQLWLELVAWDAQFGPTSNVRPATPRVLRQELHQALERDQPWTWVAERDRELVGLLMIDPPERAGWIAEMVATSPVGYLGCLVVAAGRRGRGAGAALVRTGHRALDAAGAAVTLLHYAGANPLSAPFWHRCGYRPLWTSWRARPAARLGLVKP